MTNSAKNIESLRALTTVSIKQEIRTFDGTLDFIREQATKVASEDHSTTSKKLQKLINLVGEAKKTTAHLEQRVDEAEQGFHILKMGLLTELKWEYINVPGSASEKKRAAILPSDFGKVKRKRRNAATGSKKRKSRKNKQQKTRAKKKKDQSTGTSAAAAVAEAPSVPKKLKIKEEPL